MCFLSLFKKVCSDEAVISTGYGSKRTKQNVPYQERSETAMALDAKELKDLMRRRREARLAAIVDHAQKLRGLKHLSPEWFAAQQQRQDELNRTARKDVDKARALMKAHLDEQVAALHHGQTALHLEVPSIGFVDVTWFLKETGRLHGDTFRRIVKAVEFRVDDPFEDNRVCTPVFALDTSGLNDQERTRLLDSFVDFLVKKFA